MIINYKNFIFEKLGVNDDVIKLVNFILPLISDKKNINITENIPKTTFKISKINIKFISKKDISGAFVESKSKLTKDGFIIFLLLNKNEDIKSSLYHELTHVIKYQNLTNKNIKMISKNYSYPDRRFDKLLYYLYYADDSEINARVAQIYSEIEDHIKDMQHLVNKKDIFKTYIDGLIYDEDNNPHMLIEYNIFDDLKNISEKDKIKFFRYITEYDKIKKTSNSKLKILYNIILQILFNKQNSSIDLNSIMKKTQDYINTQGEKLFKKLTKLYDLY